MGVLIQTKIVKLLISHLSFRLTDRRKEMLKQLIPMQKDWKIYNTLKVMWDKNSWMVKKKNLKFNFFKSDKIIVIWMSLSKKDFITHFHTKIRKIQTIILQFNGKES